VVKVKVKAKVKVKVKVRVKAKVSAMIRSALALYPRAAMEATCVLLV
jgi:hypothetical protein